MNTKKAIPSQNSPQTRPKDSDSQSINPVFNFDIFKADTAKLTPKQKVGLFIIETGNAWLKKAKELDIPKMLFSFLWFIGEICILFADTNLGKSILGVQIANSISRGEAIPGFNLEAEKQVVLYFDFELSFKQFENRYSEDYKNHYCFDDNFLRIEINPESDIPEGIFEDYLNKSIEDAIIKTGAKVLVIDNLTYLSNESEKAKAALPLMKNLKALKSKYALSILVLAHTPKRNLALPITRNDLAGSKMLINFCDSSFSIGESTKDKSLRYLKQIKARNTEIVFDAENVAVCQIDKPSNFLQFEFLNYSTEREHLKQQNEKDINYQTEKAKELYNKGMSLREVGLEMGMSHMKAKRLINKNVTVTEF